MKSFLILCVASVALARPDIGLKLRQQALAQQQGQVDSYGQPLAQLYGAPAKVYGPPANTYVPASVSKSTYYSGPIASQGHQLPSTQVREQVVAPVAPVAPVHVAPVAPVAPAVNFHSGYDYSHPGHVSSGSHSSSAGHVVSGGSHSTGGSHNSGYHYDQHQQQEAVVHKHVYVHLPPPEADDYVAPTVIRTAPSAPQKHYKIVFIKAPQVQQAAPIVHAQQQQSEEKTLIYVLVKKPEEGGQEVVLPAPAPATPTKPEVFFIKYKAQKDGEVRDSSLHAGLESAGQVSGHEHSHVLSGIEEQLSQVLAQNNAELVHHEPAHGHVESHHVETSHSAGASHAGGAVHAVEQHHHEEGPY